MSVARETIKRTAFVLVALGTIGLLVNEYVFGWGRVATFVFAAMSLAGLMGLSYVVSKRPPSGEPR